MSGDDPSPEASKLIAKLFTIGKRTRFMAPLRSIAALMRKGGLPPQWLPQITLEELQHIGLVCVLGTGECRLTPAGIEAAGWFEREARRVYPATTDRSLDGALAHVLRGGRYS